MSRMVRWACWGTLTACVAVFQGCSTGSGVERWQMTEAQAPQPVQPVAGSAVQPVAVVFFRDAGIATRQPINIYVNGQYQASLTGETFTEKVLCPGEHSLVAAPDDVRQRYQTKQARNRVSIGKEPAQYFRVFQNAAGQIAIAAAPRDAALAAVPSLRTRQSHTISRVSRNGCPAA